VSKRVTHLYRLWDANGELLYVGISKSAVRRLTDHQRGKPWADEINRVTITNVSTRAEAERLEIEAIANENPKYNVRHVRKKSTEELVQLQWEEMSQEERAQAVGIARKLAKQLSQLPENSARDERIAAYLALASVSLDPTSDMAELGPSCEAIR
jgi:excinuclease UvrABC nuclease subunit